MSNLPLAPRLGNITGKPLTTIIDKFNGGPVGLTTIATALGEDPGTLEVQSSAAHRGVTHGGAVLPGHPPDFQVSVVAAEILQAHGGQKLRPRQTG